MASPLNGKGLIGVGLCSIAILSLSSRRRKRGENAISEAPMHQESEGRAYSFTAYREPHQIDRLVSDSPCPGAFYQARPGDTVESICSDAICSFGHLSDGASSRSELSGYVQAVLFGRWNMMTWASRHPSALSGMTWALTAELKPEHEDNHSRIRMGLSPSSGPGKSYPLIWMPMFNQDVFDSSGEISTEGVFHDGPEGGSMSAIDPPESIMSLGVTADSWRGDSSP